VRMSLHLAILLLASSCQARSAELPAEEHPPFCGKPEKHQVIQDQRGEPAPFPKDKARVYLFWRGARWRWLGVQCKVALNGKWVAVLSPNTYSAIDVEPGKLRFCAAGNRLQPTWRSLLFLHARVGETYYIECSPGGDELGANDPTLSEPEPAEGMNTVSKSRLVTFDVKSRR